MKRSKLIIWVVMLVIIASAAVLVNWTVLDFYTPAVEWVKKAAKSEASSEPEKASETQTPSDANELKEERTETVAVRGEERSMPRRGGQGRFPRERGELKERFGSRRRVNEPNEPNKPVEPSEVVEPNDPLEALNLKDVQMKDIIQKLAKWTGKVIIPSDEAMKQKVTIYSAEKVPRSQALSMIYSALRAKGFVAEQTDNMIYLKPITEAKLGSVPTIAADYPLAAIENKNSIVQKFFKLVNYSPTRMGEIILPLVGDYGYVSADENTGSLLVIDTVENLIRIGRIIAQFDVPEAEQTVTEIFEIRHGDPAEIVQLLRLLLGDDSGRSTRVSSRRGGSSSRSTPQRNAPPTTGDAKAGMAAATSVVVGPSQTPIVLIPEPRRKWVIARASAEDMKQIRWWIEKLDREEPVESEYEIISITYADVSEVASRLNEALQQLPGTELKASVLVQPLTQARQIMIFGRADMREMVKKLIEEIDVPPGLFITDVIDVNYADPDQIKKNIDDLYGEGALTGGRYSSMFYYGSRRTTISPDTVKIISYPSRKQVTVIASAENMAKIKKQIKEWDVPIDVEQVKPRIIPLQNTDPKKMATLLSTLFSERAADRFSYFDYMFGDVEEKRKIVGPLYGQLTFEAVPDTKKIIVISNIPEAYAVVEDLIRKLDRQEMAEVPKVVTLNYADPEELSERLNAIFSEPGTPATIRLGQRGLSETGMEETEGEGSSGDEESSGQQDVYTPPWTKGRTKIDEMPISNVIGRIRFIPDPRSKAVLVLAPPEFMDHIEEMIKELDKPGKQVRIKAIVVEVDHSEVTSLGLQLASPQPELPFGALEENAITAFANLAILETYGSLTLEAGTNVTTLVDFLVRTTNAKILNQQTLWTKDNEEADFFKGQRVAFITSTSFSTEGGRESTSYEYPKVGMTLRVRPSITPQKNVDMNIDLTISQLSAERINLQPVRTYMNTTTTSIVQDGQTIMLGGILFQEDSIVERKVALLGDLPLVGPLFRHNETVESNNELIIFITPQVIDEDAIVSEAINAEKKLESMLRQLNSTIEGDE